MNGKDDNLVITNYTGQNLGSYRLLHLLGRGGSASVYLGEHIYLKRLAAIKILRTVLGEPEKKRFLDEARLLAGLSHPHIVGVLEFDVLQLQLKRWSDQPEKNIPFLIMYYMPNGSLRTRYPSGSSLPLELVLNYIKQVAAPLQYAHDHGVIHRDIKPENLLLNEQQEVMLSDFGLALFAPAPELLTQQEVAGSLPYSAPEQLRGKPHFASDQYSLAIIAYEWLCGRRPFQGEEVEIMMQQVSTAPPSLRSQKLAISEAVEEAIFTALEKDPLRRYSSVQEFARALERASKWKLYSFSSYFHPPITLPSLQRSQNESSCERSLFDSGFEFQKLDEMSWSPDTDKITATHRHKKQPGLLKKAVSRLSGKNLTILSLIAGALVLVLVLNIISYSGIGTVHNTPATHAQTQGTLVGEVDFVDYPPLVQNLRMTKNEAVSINNIAVLGAGQQVIVIYNLETNYFHKAYLQRPDIFIVVHGYVSRTKNKAGYAPFTLAFNTHYIVNDFTMPGEGYAPSISSFQVSEDYLLSTDNQIIFTVSPRAGTKFCIYSLQVAQVPKGSVG